MANNEGTKLSLVEQYIARAADGITFPSEDIVGIFKNVFLELEEIHANDLIALDNGLAGFASNEQENLCLAKDQIKPVKTNLSAVNKVLPDLHGSFNILSQDKMVTDLSSGDKRFSTESEEEHLEIKRPMLMKSYQSFETILEHHDPLTDLQVMGLLMASLAFGCDLQTKEGLEKLEVIMRHPSHAVGRIHPNLAGLILDLVQLDRRARVRDAYSARIRLENYALINPGQQESFNEMVDAYEEKAGDRNKWILSKLKNRLFDLSRRNSLVYFKKSARFVNLTLSSVPLVLDYKNIRPESLFMWNEKIETYLKSSKKIPLNQFLRVNENPQIAVSLRKVNTEATRDIGEYGFNQLRMVVGFLNWYNFKENKSDKIRSPLLLVPVKLHKKKGIKDNFTLEPLTTEAEVNPALSYLLRELFDIKLPVRFDLSEVSIQDIFQDIKNKIESKSNEVKLEMLNKPSIRLIHSLAKQSFDRYSKRVKSSLTKNIWQKSGTYSYRHPDYQPLGVQLFKKQVRSEYSLTEFLLDTKVILNPDALAQERHKEMYHLENEGVYNPYQWEFDLCNFTLGNFNYKSMSLVNDYDNIIADNLNNEIFERLFSQEPKQLLGTQKQASFIKQCCVIPADPSQLSAINLANKGESYIIQGPPGTGKSQTIANLLSNYVAQGKSVLFISEKRAALDVVYQRMTQVGLEKLCTLIHDSQSDKRSFIQDLKATYEFFLETENEFDAISKDKENLVDAFKKLEDKLVAHHLFHKGSGEEQSTISLIHRVISGDQQFIKSLANKAPSVPELSTWEAAKEKVFDLSKELFKSGKFKEFSHCALLPLADQLVMRGGDDQFSERINQLESKINQLLKLIKPLALNRKSKFVDIHNLSEQLKALRPFHQRNILDLLDPNSSTCSSFQSSVKELTELRKANNLAADKNINWKQKPNVEELDRLSKQYAEASTGFINSLFGKKKKFKDSLAKFYDFEKDRVAKEPEDIFQELQAELSIQMEIIEKERLLEDRFFISNQTQWVGVYAKWEALVEKYGNDQEKIKQIFDNADALNTLIAAIREEGQKLFPDFENLGSLEDQLDELRIALEDVYGLLPLIRQWNLLDDSLKNWLWTTGKTFDQADFLMAKLSLAKREEADLAGARLTGVQIHTICDQLGKLYHEILTINARLVEGQAIKLFQDHVNLSMIPVYELSDAQKAIKINYREGRKILENEFRKKIRYKSIRELAGGASTQVINDLKPIWMMSPLSVSDTLPVEQLFDIVVFDEASQITVEEGVPPLYRANQAIIVGDEMQMPPTNFFSVKIAEEDQLESRHGISLDAESLLNLSARNMPIISLMWHYRSRREALINFSNAGFYERKLLTIPDVQSPLENLDPITVFEAKDAENFCATALTRSISFHHLPNGTYLKRSNEDEADYIAQLIRQLLKYDFNKSIGVVAFSMEQQNIIEQALQHLANLDPEFEALLEKAYHKSETDLSENLFVKNLENVQGDERDIIILSICYGYNPNGKMLMNFGPINRRGGEKRLNVIFSRAKHNMMVVSSIQHQDIKNEYNEGANFLKQYLKFAALTSVGNHETAQAVLSNLYRAPKRRKSSTTQEAVLAQIKNWLNTEGYQVQLNYGASSLKVDLAVFKSEASQNFILGIGIDHPAFYQEDNVLEQYYLKPNIMQQFGWRYLRILSMDWLYDQHKVKNYVLEYLNNSDSPEIETEKESVPIYPPETVTTKIEKILLMNKDTGKFWSAECNDKTVIIGLGSSAKSLVENVKLFDTGKEALAFYEDQVENRKERGFEVTNTEEH